MNKATNSSALLINPPTASTNVAGTNDIREIKAPVEIPSTWAWVLWAVGAALAFALVLGAWKRWKRKQSQPALVVIIPPEERARKKLEDALRLLDQPKPFCIAVSDALREYLEERFGLHAPDRTTEEFLFELQGTTQLNITQKQSLEHFLERCDLVKFARDEPTQVALRDLHEAALRLISETEPPPVPKTAEADQPVTLASRG